MIGDEYYCPNCNAVLNEQIGFDPGKEVWTCKECGETLYGDDVESTMEEFDGVVWYCDECNAVLNTQYGFHDSCGTWYCKKCGHENFISEEEIYESKADYDESRKHSCPECGSIIEDQYSFYEGEDIHTCTDCDTDLYLKDDEYVVAYRCPNCDELLNEQLCFDDYDSEWECDNCGTALVKDQNGFYVRAEDYDDDDYESEPVGATRISRRERRRIAKEEKERLKKENRAKRIEFCIKHWKSLLLLIAVVCVSCFGGYKYYQYQRSIPVGISSDELIGQNYEEVVDALKKAGFSRVSSTPQYDIGINELNIEGTVESVNIDGNNSFPADKRFQFDSRVIVSYHKIKDIQVPCSAKEASKMQYEDLKKQLEDAGFVNIKVEPKKDLIKGWLKKEGEVKTITINGDSSFEANTSYRPDAEIIIVYHALR